MSEQPQNRQWPGVPPFQGYLGIEILEFKDGTSLVRLPWKQELCNRKGDIHGGASATLVDLAMSFAIRSASVGVAGLSTINMTVTYLEPARGTLTASGRMIKAGRTIGMAEATVRSEDGTIVATANGAFRLIWPKSQA